MSMIQTPINPLLGGSLSTGPTGLAGLTGGNPLSILQGLPYGPAPISGLASQVPLGVGADAAAGALGLGGLAGGAAPSAAGSAGRSLASRASGLIPGLGSAEGGLLANFSKPTLAKGIGYGLAGQIGSNVIGGFDLGGADSALDQALTYAAQGAGLGAPFGPWGAAVGGVGGGAYGILHNMFGGGGDGAPEVAPVEVLATAIQRAGLNPDYTEQVMQTYDTLIALADGLEGDAKDAAINQAFQQTSAMILQAMQQQQATQQQAAGNASNTLALQQQAQQIFQPLADDIRTSSNLYAQAMGGIRDQLPESYRAVSDATVARELTSADRLANAYQAQAALTPVVNQLTRYQQDQDAFAQQMFSQQLAQQAAAMNQGGFGSPGAVNNNLLSQLVPT